MTDRIIFQFSCGAASAVATKLLLPQFDPSRVVIVNAFLQEEHEDNRRFAADCELWFGHPITQLRDEKYGASVHEVWRKTGYMKGQFGASCSMRLKRELLDSIVLPGDVLVMGFTAEEEDRAARYIECGVLCPLIDRGLTKADCLAIVERAGIRLPAMYELGFNNANCIGCCKGGMGYWNHVRRVFPERFEEVAVIEQEIGTGAFLFYDRTTKQRFSLRELPPGAGTHNEILPDCSFQCAIAEEDITCSQ